MIMLRIYTPDEKLDYAAAIRNANPQQVFDAAKLLHPDWTSIQITVVKEQRK